MAKNPEFIVQVMEKVGSPLIASVSDVSVRLQAGGNQTQNDPAQQLAEDSKKVAGLLNKSVQVAIAVSNMLDLPAQDNQADSVRLALTALASPMLANQYRMSTRLPGDNDVKKLVTSLEAVMTFSDNFSVAGDAGARLDQIDKDFFPADPAQIQILYIQALVPTVSQIANFPFGQSERKLVQEVADRLIKKANEITSANFPDLQGGPAKKCELGILRSLSTIYSQCHFGEMARLMSLPQDQRDQQTSMDPVWEAFEKRASLLEILAQTSVPAGRDDPAPQTQQQMPQQAAPINPPPADGQTAGQAPPGTNQQTQTQSNQGSQPSSQDSQSAGNAQSEAQISNPQHQQVQQQQQQRGMLTDTPQQQQPQQQQTQEQPPQAQTPPPVFQKQPPAGGQEQPQGQTQGQTQGQQQGQNTNQMPPAESSAQQSRPPDQEVVDNSDSDEEGDTGSQNPMSFFKKS